MYEDLICDEFNKTIKIMQMFICNKSYISMIESAAKIIVRAFEMEGKVLSCGNGGSHCSAMHFAEELTGRYRENRPGYPAVAISDSAYLSCVSNDFGYDKVFSRYVESVGKMNDVLFAISTSGKSVNVLNAIKIAYKKGMKVIFLTRVNAMHHMSNYIDFEICVPYVEYSDYIQEIHIKIIHMIILIIEREMSILLK